MRQQQLTVAITGPTGEIGISAVTALEQDPAVERIIGMARRPFDPASHGWTKTTYQQGDIMDRAAVDAMVANADDATGNVNISGGGGPSPSPSESPPPSESPTPSTSPSP